MGSLRHRLIVLADMGNEPDEEQQMVHMIMCSNEFDLDGLIAVTGKYLRPESDNPYKRVTHPELFHGIIDAYEKVLGNLRQHAGGWHEPQALRRLVVSGQSGYGMAGVGEGETSQGSELIIQALEKDDPRPIWLVVNAGSNTLAQALWAYRSTHGEAHVDALVRKLRVFENGAQDDAGAWCCHNFPQIHWIRSNYQTYCYGGPSVDGGFDNTGDQRELGPYTWEPYPYSSMGQHQWALEHIKGDHGPLGMAWPLRQFEDGRISFLEGGGTTPWMGLVNKGLFDIDQPHWGSWSGRFGREKTADYYSKHAEIKAAEEAFTPFHVYKEEADRWVEPGTGKEHLNVFAPVWRWRRAYFNDFVCRMDWCVKPPAEANHHPIAAFRGDRGDSIVRLVAKAGETVPLDGSASFDPDDDGLAFSWWNYREAGTYPGSVVVSQSDEPIASVTLPHDADGRQIHVVLEVTDDNPIASLYDYRRIVIDVE